MPTSADGTAPPGFWGCRALRADGTVASVTVVLSQRHADGEAVELPEADATAYVGDDGLARADVDPTGRVTGLWVSPRVAPKAPPLWFVELPEPGANPPATNVLAFTGHGAEPGRLLDGSELAATGVPSRDQLAAVRIYPGTGRVDQVYVAPAWRRRSIGSTLLLAAGILVFSRDWALLWADGQRTADGDRLVRASLWRHRVAPMTNLAPPMTPDDQR